MNVGTNKTENGRFITTEIGLTAYLLAVAYREVTMRTFPKLNEFSFELDDQLSSDVTKYYNNSAMAPARRLLTIRRHLIIRLRDLSESHSAHSATKKYIWRKFKYDDQE